MQKSLTIHNSTAEFLIFQIEGREDGIEVLYRDESIWCTQDAIATLFDRSRSTIAEHLRNIFSSGELIEDSVCRKFRRTASDGKEHNTKAHPNNRTQQINKDYQLVCLLAKADTMAKSLNEVGERYYRNESFIHVINTGRSVQMASSLSFEEIKTNLVHIYNAA